MAVTSQPKSLHELIGDLHGLAAFSEPEAAQIIEEAIDHLKKLEALAALHATLSKMTA